MHIGLGRHDLAKRRAQHRKERRNLGESLLQIGILLQQISQAGLRCDALGRNAGGRGFDFGLQLHMGADGGTNRLLGGRSGGRLCRRSLSRHAGLVCPLEQGARPLERTDVRAVLHHFEHTAEATLLVAHGDIQYIYKEIGLLNPELGLVLFA